MIKDRTASLLRVLAERNDEPEDEMGYFNYAMDMDDDAVYMDHYFKRVVEIREWIDKINSNVEAIRTLHSQLLSSPRTDVHVKSELEARTETVKELGKKISYNLKDLQKKIEEEETSEEEHKSETKLRIRKTQHSTTMQLYVEAMMAFTQAQNEYKDRCYDRIHRVISIAEADITEEKLEELLEKGDYGAIFNGDIILETIDVQRALLDVQLRHQELITLEKSIAELRDLFVDMAFLVDKQGELIDNIESHVLAAGEHVEVAKVNMKKAVKYRSKARYKKICLIVFMIILVAAIILGLVLYFKPNSSSSSEPNPTTAPKNESSS